MKKNSKCHFPQITKDFKKKKKGIIDLQIAQLMELGMDTWWLYLDTFGHWGTLERIFTSGKF